MIRLMTSDVSTFSGFVANGHQALQHVSSSPSKIPYVGFSPIRLQTGIQQPPSPGRHCLSARPAFTSAAQTYRLPKLRIQSRVIYQRYRWLIRSRAKAQSGLHSISSKSGPVQRPLALRRVMLSRQVIAHYGLIRNSRPLPPIYVLYGGSLPYGLVWAGIERLPNLLRMSFFSVPPSVPRWTGQLPAAVPSLAVIAFSISAQDRHPQPHARRFPHGLRNEAAKFTLCYGPEKLIALHRQGRLLSSFRPRESPLSDVEYNYTGKQPIPVTGLSPVRHAALWAANRDTENIEKIFKKDFAPLRLAVRKRFYHGLRNDQD